MADPEREVYVLVGDGSYLMMSSRDRDLDPGGLQADDRADRQRRLQEHRRAEPLAGPGGLRHALRLPAEWRAAGRRRRCGRCETLPVDLAANARSLGAHVIECARLRRFRGGAATPRATRTRTTVIYIQNDRLQGVPGYESWWDVPVAEVSEMPAVRRRARRGRPGGRANVTFSDSDSELRFGPDSARAALRKRGYGYHPPPSRRGRAADDVSGAAWTPPRVGRSLPRRW